MKKELRILYNEPPHITRYIELFIVQHLSYTCNIYRFISSHRWYSRWCCGVHSLSCGSCGSTDTDNNKEVSFNSVSISLIPNMNLSEYTILYKLAGCCTKF